MKRKIVLFVLALAFILPMIFSVQNVSAQFKIPVFFIKEVTTDVSVSVETKDFPANVDFTVMMGEYNTRGVNGIEVGKLNSGAGGAFAATFNIPDQLKGRNTISIRMEGTGGWYSFNFFINNPSGSWPGVPSAPSTPSSPATPAPSTTPKPVVVYPSFSITAVKANDTVTIKGINFPADTDFVVKMGKMWTMGLNGIDSATFNSGAGGSFEATYPIPAELKGLQRISIRMDGVGGWYAYNWFWNNSTN